MADYEQGDMSLDEIHESIDWLNTQTFPPRRVTVCVRCGEPVRAPRPHPITGQDAHPGHVDPTRDRTCGTWGFKRVASPDRDLT